MTLYYRDRETGDHCVSDGDEELRYDTRGEALSAAREILVAKAADDDADGARPAG